MEVDRLRWWSGTGRHGRQDDSLGTRNIRSPAEKRGRDHVDLWSGRGEHLAGRPISQSDQTHARGIPLARNGAPQISS